MTRRLVVLLLAAVLCAGIGGVLLLEPPVGAGSGWTAYSPLSGTAYRPDLTWPTWRPRLGAALLALGAGTAGAGAATVLLLRRSRVQARAAAGRDEQGPSPASPPGA